MRFVLVRPRLWFAVAVLGLALTGACSLNPQPLPPGSYDTATGDDAESTGMGSAGAPSDGGRVAEQDAASEGGGLPIVVVGGADAGATTDASTDGAPNDAALDGSSTGDTGCATALDCGCTCDERDATGE